MEVLKKFFIDENPNQKIIGNWNIPKAVDINQLYYLMDCKSFKEDVKSCNINKK